MSINGVFGIVAIAVIVTVTHRLADLVFTATFWTNWNYLSSRINELKESCA